MSRRTPRSCRTLPLFPYTTLVRFFGRRPERGQAVKVLQREPPAIEAIAGFGEKLDDRAVIAGLGAVGEAAEGDGAAGVEVEPGVAEAGAQPQQIGRAHV